MLRQIYVALRTLARSLIFDRGTGIDTDGIIRLHELGLAAKDRVDYQASGWLVLKPVLSRRDVSEEDVFLDFGCGKGRMLYLAAMYPFKRVIGVELSAELAAIARKNIEKALPKLTCKDVDIVHKDALEYDVPDDVTVVYFYNPFEGEIFARVVDKLLESLRRRPRLMRIICCTPIEEDTLIRAGARLVKVAGATWPYKAAPDKPSVKLYTLGGDS